MVWSDTEVEQLDTGSMITRLASYRVDENGKRPRRVQLHELSPHIRQRRVSYAPSKRRIDEKCVYLWPLYPQPQPRDGDVDVLKELLDIWFRCDPR